jgi:hypothetical protein
LIKRKIFGEGRKKWKEEEREGAKRREMERIDKEKETERDISSRKRELIVDRERI